MSLVQGDLATVGGAPTWTPRHGGLSRTYTSGGRDKFASNARRQLTGAVTAVAGFVSTTGASSSGWHAIFDKRPSASNTAFEFALNFNNGGTLGTGVQFQWNTGSAYQSVIGPTSDKVTPNVFHVMAGTRPTAATSGKLYLGQIRYSVGSLSAPGSNSTSVNLGANTDGSEGFEGSMFFGYLWNRELSLGEIEMIRSAPYDFLVAAQRRAYVWTTATPPASTPLFLHQLRQQQIA